MAIRPVAQFPYFIFSPSTLLSVVGLVRGADKTRPTPARDWRTATVDVIIPARNEQDNIVRCLAAVLRQTRRPRRIVVVDDGSSDATAARAQAFSDFHRADVVVSRRATSTGKTPTIKQHARALDSDVLFVLDADTVLESDNYIERTVQELYQGVGIASAWGSVLPLREKDRVAADESTEVRSFVETSESLRPAKAKSWLRRLASGVTNMSRRVPDISKIQKLIGYRPTVQLEEILERVIEYWTPHPAAPAPAIRIADNLRQLVGAAA